MTAERFQELLQYRKDITYTAFSPAYNGSYPITPASTEIIRRIDAKLAKYLELE